jgi:hypothetical protein
MKPIVCEYFEAELDKAHIAIETQDFESAWIALQRAHILGQTEPMAHAIAHWNMLKLAWKQRDVKEIAGQLMPTLLAIPLTLFFGQRRLLRGGKANLDEKEKMSIPEDIQQVLKQ